MPLITFTGYPCSGKTKWALQLQEQLKAKITAAREDNSPGHNYSVIYHSDETLGITPEAYTDSNLEKTARGAQMTAVKRDLSRSNFVILDSLAYIKGFRYQLFCEAKGVVTPHCVIHVVSPLEQCEAWNRNKQPQWPEGLIKQLEMRYEEPNDATRWDSPLFTVVSGEDDELPINDIWDALVLKRPPPPNAATLVKATSGNNFLQELDKQTLAVVGKILQHQELHSVGGDVLVGEGLVVSMPAVSVSTAQLQRLRRTFISLNRMRSVDIDRITPLFVDYVRKAFEEE